MRSFPKWFVTFQIAAQLAITAFASLASGAGSADRRCEALFTEHRISRPTKEITAGEESTVEVEIGASDKVLKLFTTINGTIAPVLGFMPARQALGHELTNEIQDAYPDRSLTETEWDLLSPTEQRKVLMNSARWHDFNTSRTVPGLKFRDSVTLELRHPLTVGPRLYFPGRVTIPTRDIFGTTTIEYMSASRMTSDLGLELHVRTAATAKDNFLLARALQRALSGRADNVHAHITGPYPRLVSEGQVLSRVDAFRMTTFFGFARMAFDFLMIERGFPFVSLVVVHNLNLSSSFSPSHPENLEMMFNVLRYPTFRDLHLKSGTIGIRGATYYDKDVWGFEIRYLPDSIPDDRLGRGIENIQERLTSGRYFMTEQEARLQSPHTIAGYDLSFRIMGDITIHPSHPDLGDLIKDDATYERLWELAEKNSHLRYVYADWRNMIYTRNWSPEKMKRLFEVQRTAVKMLLAGAPSTDVAKYFIQRSGLMHSVFTDFDLLP